MHYFAQDGNYGDPNGLIIIDTTSFTENDWNEIDMAPDRARVAVALDIYRNK